MTVSEERLVVVVTGANSGVGFSICHRLLLQLAGELNDESYTEVPTADDAPSALRYETAPVTLVLACRNENRAADARQRLLDLLAVDLAHQSAPFKTGDRRTALLDRLRIETAVLDLSSVDSVFKFCDDVNRRYDYITHLFLNAGTGNFSALNWGRLITQFLTQPMRAMTHPEYKGQTAGVLTEDGFGLVWQSNVFGHYMMVRLLTPLLSRSPFGNARIIWTTSLEANAAHYSQDDWQLTSSKVPYEVSKLQQELISVQLDRCFAKDQATSRIRSLAFEPGVVASSIYTAQLNWFLDKAMILFMYLARWFSSTAESPHVVSCFKGAVSAVHVAFLSFAMLPRPGDPVKYGSRVSRTGVERSVPLPIAKWDEEEAALLVSRCEALFNALKGRSSYERDEERRAPGAV